MDGIYSGVFWPFDARRRGRARAQGMPETSSDSAEERDRTVMGEAALDQLEDAALVRLSLDGRRDAFDVIVERHRRAVYQLCYRFVSNHEDASDLAQDVFIRAYRGLRGFKGQSALGTWLYRIGVNVCLNRVSVKGPKTEAFEAVERVDMRVEPADRTLVRAETAAQVRAAIARLPRKQRATLILRAYHELPHEEIAKILGSSVGAVKANFFHALANLKKILQGER